MAFGIQLEEILLGAFELNRICLLFGDLEKNTERQISRELRYLIPIFKGKILEKNDITNLTLFVHPN